MKIAFACAAALLASGAVAAAQTTPAAAPAPAKVKKVCKTDPATVGSRFTRRVCLTEQEWASRAGSAEDSKRRLLDQAEREGREYNPYPKPGG